MQETICIQHRNVWKAPPSYETHAKCALTALEKDVKEWVKQAVTYVNDKKNIIM